MAKFQLTTKKVQIDKAQATIVATIGIAVFVTVFSLVSSKSLWTQRTYQAKVISKKEAARDQLITNVESVRGLVTSYKQFVNSSTNIIDGNPSGNGERDGDNARLVLDALPSKYDFPALTSSLEKILTDRNFKIDGITGVDDEVAQSAVSESGAPTPIEMPFQVSVDSSQSAIEELVKVLEKSIRPFNVQKMTLLAEEGSLKMTADIKTYFQPEKTLNTRKEVVK